MDAVALAEKIKDESPSLELDGVKYYIVEQDRKVEETNLQSYAAEVIAGFNPSNPPPTTMDRLVVATVGGKPIRWKLPVVLTWTIDESTFQGRSNELAKARKICEQATRDWNEAAKAGGIDDRVRFENNSRDPVFRFAFEAFPNPNLYAVAFFPSDPPNKRVVYIGPATFKEPTAFDAVGVIRHELGHVLGFRHEHIRPEAQQGMEWWERSQMEQWVIGRIGGEILTKYDKQSVMHYPLNGAGNRDFKLSDKDKAGFQKLYSLPSGSPDLREYPI